MAKNKVIAGDYNGKKLECVFGVVYINTGWGKTLNLDKESISEYEVVDEEKRKSVISAVGRGLVGSLLIGAPGLLAGLTAKSKGVHVLAIEFKDGKKSLIEVDDKLYKALTKKLF